MRVRLPEVICDTSFLMHVASGRIRNLDDVGFEVGPLEYVVPSVVMVELERLADSLSKGYDAVKAIRLARGMRRVEMPGKYADRSIVDHIRARGGYVATVDKKLKWMVKSAGGRIVSLHDNCVVLEPSSQRQKA